MPQPPDPHCMFCAGTGIITNPALTRLGGPVRKPGDPVPCICVVTDDDTPESLAGAAPKSLEQLLLEFPKEWDVDLALCVCCRGETFNGPPGVRRWMAIAIPRMPTHDEITAGNLPEKTRLESACSDTPRDAVVDIIERIQDHPEWKFQQVPR